MLTVDRKQFAKALSSFKGLVKKSVIPIIECVLLHAKDGVLTIEGTNLDQSMRLTVPADGSLPRTAVNFERVERFVSAAAGADCSLSLADERLTLRSARARAAIPCRAEGDFPPSIPPREPDFAAPVAMWSAMMRFCADAAGNEASRYYLVGVFLDLSEAPCAVTTDGGCLSLFKLADIYQEKLPTFDGGGRIVPLAPFYLLQSACEEKDVGVCLSADAIEFVWPAGAIRSKLVDGTFPDWRRILAYAALGPSLTCGLLELLTAASRALAASGETAIGFSAEPGKLRLRANKGSGEPDAEDEVEAELTGVPFTFGLKGTFLLNALKALDDKSEPTVTITSTGKGSHLRLSVAGSESLRVIMPMTRIALPDGLQPEAKAA